MTRLADDMPSGVVLVCDLDGTLLRSDGRLTAYTRDALGALLGAGVSVTLASARSTAAIRGRLDGLQLELPVIELNGVFVSELQSGKHLVSRLLDRAAARAACELLVDRRADPVLTTFDGLEDHVYFSPRSNPGTAWYVAEKRGYGDPRLRDCEDVRDIAAAERVATVTTFVPGANADALVAELKAATGGNADVLAAENRYCPGWEVQIQRSGADTATALGALLEHVGLAGAEIVACGDHLNDLPLFNIATRSVAPANAHPAALVAATHVVASNDEDGVARHLLEELLGL